jgi:hypothetical protein
VGRAAEQIVPEGWLSHADILVRAQAARYGASGSGRSDRERDRLPAVAEKTEAPVAA